MGWAEENFGRGGTGYLTTWRDNPDFVDMVDVVVGSKPDIVVVSGGFNDMRLFLANPEPVAVAINETFTQLRSRLPRARIVAVGPSAITPTAEVLALDSDVQAAARIVGAVYVSLLAPTLVLQPGMYSAVYAAHPNDAGYIAIANRVLSILQPT
jgi:lysophospholipase L1-like esterase